MLKFGLNQTIACLTLEDSYFTLIVFCDENNIRFCPINRP